MASITSGYNEAEIQEFIESRLSNEDFLDALYAELSQFYPNTADLQKLSSQQICQIIVEKNLLEKIISTVHSYNMPHEARVKATPESVQNAAIASKEFMIYLRLNEGRCFTDFLQEHPGIKFAISISFLSQRFLSDEISACEEPKFNQVKFFQANRPKGLPPEIRENQRSQFPDPDQPTNPPGPNLISFGQNRQGRLQQRGFIP
jgi:hypothetical protein